MFQNWMGVYIQIILLILILLMDINLGDKIFLFINLSLKNNQFHHLPEGHQHHQ